MAHKSPTIAYIAQVLPNLHATFIYREIFALQKIGFDIVPLSVHRADPNALSAEAPPLAERTEAITPFRWGAFAAAHAEFLLKKPIVYLKTLAFLLTRPGESPKNRLRTLMHFMGAVFLAARVKNRGLDHIHAHFSFNAATIALVMSRLLGITFSFTAHNNFFTDQIVLKEKLREARFIVAISEFSRDFLLNILPNDASLPGKFHIVHCGVSPDVFVPPAHRPPDDPPLLFSVAHFTERKGFHILVEACRILHQRGVPFTCIIAGDGEQRPQLEQMIADYGLGDVVQLPGAVFQENLRDYLNRADVFALPCVVARNGDMDGVPVALMEAMSMEIATVSTTVSGIPELIDDGLNGLLVPPDDPAALADAIERLLADESLRRRLGQAARQKIIDAFDVDKSATQIADLFRRQFVQ